MAYGPIGKFTQDQVIRNVHSHEFDALRVLVVNGVTEPIPVTIVDSAANKLVILDDTNYLNTDFTVGSYTQIFTNTATQDYSIKDIKIKAPTFGSFRLKIGGVIKDYTQISELYRNGLFHYNNTLDILDTEILTIEFSPNRIQITNFNFFIRIEGNT